MNISYNWLKEYIDFQESPEEIAEILTQTGLEVEGIEKVEKIKGGLQGIVVGEVLTCEQHPNADKLKKTTVDIGVDEPSNIVCGAPNVAAGQKVLVATLNTTLYPSGGEPFKIKKAKIRGEVSAGMICAEDEIGLGKSHAGIMVLDTDKPNGTPASELFELGEDYVLEIGLTPNRGDATSHFGTARDLKAFFKKELTKPSFNNWETKTDNPISVKVENSEACPRYSGLLIRGVKVQDSPDWLQWKLRSIGLEPINNIVDITNYILHGIGQPMHAFDADKITTGEIVVKNLPTDTKFTTLDDKERKLHANDLMICNGADEGMCIAGVFGGKNSGVSEKTTNVFLESAFFSADSVRATAQRHVLSTDASFRYERGTDPEITIYALQLATSLVLEIAGGTVSSEIIDIYPNKISPVKIPITFAYIHKIIGKELAKDEIISILNHLDISTENVTDVDFVAIAPPYRSDVTRPADVVEEVLRIYGLNNIELEENLSTSFLASFREHEPHVVQQNISKFLAGKGFSEILTNSLTNPNYHEKFPVSDDTVSVLNPSSEELAMMKTTPIYTILESVAYNINRRATNLKFFEFSKSYHKLGEGYDEKEYLSIVFTGNTLPENWMDTPRKVSFHDLSANVLSMLDYVGIRKTELLPIEGEKLYSYVAEIKYGKESLGKIGMLKPALTDIYGIEQPIFYAELAWEQILKRYKSDVKYEPISKFPEVKRDLSLVLDKSISYREIQQIAHAQEKKLLNKMRLFSIYEGEKIEKNKKAYAISFFLQDKYKTLTDKQIDKTMNALMNAFENKLNALIRR